MPETSFNYEEATRVLDNVTSTNCFAEAERAFYLVCWAKGWEVGTTEKHLLERGYTPEEITKARKEKKPCMSPEQREAQDWNILSHRVVGAEELLERDLALID